MLTFFLHSPIKPTFITEQNNSIPTCYTSSLARQLCSHCSQLKLGYCVSLRKLLCWFVVVLIPSQITFCLMII